MAGFARYIVVGGSGVALCAACADLGGLAGGSSGGPDGGGAMVADGSTGDGTVTDGGILVDSGDGAVGVVPAMVIQCASTTTTCDGRMAAECCLTVTGTDSVAVRELGTLNAKCQAKGGPNCGSYVSVGPDFTMKLPQSCARTVDCDMGLVCCAISSNAQRLSTELSAIGCVAQSACATTGRTLCDSSVDCPATLNCLAETDPVLSKLYKTWCR